MVVAWGDFLLLAACARALRRLIHLPALLCCEAMVWAVTFLASPLRMLTAVDAERTKLRRLVAEMQAQMDGLVWVNRDLEEKLRAALREHDAMDALLDEMEDEHDGAVARIHHLEAQLTALRQENMRLNEHKGKSMWDDTKAAAGQAPAGTPHECHCHDAAAAAAVDFKAESSAADDPASAVLSSLTTTAPPPAAAGCDDALAARQAKEAVAVARRRSLFSLAMSVAVGGVAWSADAPCLPLLAGLFAVVGVSMRSVLSRCTRRGDGAVALLSLNWFLLGVLTSPVLPGVARAVAPRAARAVLTWFAAAAPVMSV